MHYNLIHEIFPYSLIDSSNIECSIRYYLLMKLLAVAKAERSLFIFVYFNLRVLVFFSLVEIVKWNGHLYIRHEHDGLNVHVPIHFTSSREHFVQRRWIHGLNIIAKMQPVRLSTVGLPCSSYYGYSDVCLKYCLMFEYNLCTSYYGQRREYGKLLPSKIYVLNKC